MPRNRGYSLLETLITTTLSTILLLGFLGTAGRLQVWYADLNLALQRDQNLWLSPLLLTRWVLHAGNNRWQQVWPGVTTPEGVLRLNSDIDGPRGFPDGELNDSFERVSIRSSQRHLQLKSGNGFFQPLLRNIDQFVTDTSQFPLLSIDLEAVPERPFVALPEASRKPAHLMFLLRTYHRNLFPEYK